MKHKYLKTSNPTVWEDDVLFVRLILDHTFVNVYWRNNQSYFHDNGNYFSNFQKIKEKKL